MIRVNRRNRRQLDPSFPPIGPCLNLVNASGADGTDDLTLVLPEGTIVELPIPLTVSHGADPVLTVSAFSWDSPTELLLTLSGNLPVSDAFLQIPPAMTAIRGPDGGLLCQGSRKIEIL